MKGKNIGTKKDGVRISLGQDTAQDFYSYSKQQNECRINRVSGMLDIAVLLCCILMYVLNAAGVFILDSSKILLLTLAILPFSAFSFIIGTLLKIEKAWVKYMIILDECAIILMAYSVLSMHVIMILVLPLLKASLYFNKKVTVITYVVSSAMLLIGHIASVYFSIVFDDPVIVSLPA